jgi:hypothetical protein
MTELVRAFSQGGPFMMVILAFGLLHGIPIVIQLFMVKKVDLTPYLWAGLAAVLMLGVLASLLGLSRALSAVAQASPEQMHMLVASGITTAINTSALAVLVTLPGFFLTGIGASLVRTLKPVRTRPPRP